MYILYSQRWLFVKGFTENNSNKVYLTQQTLEVYTIHNGGRQMSTDDKIGGLLHANDLEARKLAASLMGRVKSERKTIAARENGKKTRFTPEHREKLKEAQRLRREREKAEQEEAGLTTNVEKKPVGRPRKAQGTQAEAAPKRGRGRPRKDGQISLPLNTERGNP